MGKKHEMADAIRRLAIQYQQMVEAADVLESIGSLENVTTELNKQAEAGRKELEYVSAELAKAKDDVKKAKAEALAIRKAADEFKDERVKEVMAQAQEVTDAAKANAEAIRSAALAEPTEELAKIKKDISRQRSELKKLNEQVSEAEAAIPVKQKEVDALEAKLAKIKADLAKMLG